jgi:hypothetical protein
MLVKIEAVAKYLLKSRAAYREAKSVFALSLSGK